MSEDYTLGIERLFYLNLSKLLEKSKKFYNTLVSFKLLIINTHQNSGL